MAQNWKTGRRLSPAKLGWALGWIFILSVPSPVGAQSSLRLLLASGSSVPGHAGFVFGPFSDLAMSENREIIFLSTLRSPRSEIRAVVRSSGVTFSAVAFQGLRAPVPKTTYDSFSAPSLNASGSIAFTAALKDSQEAPASAVVRIEGSSARAIATTADSVPGQGDAKFQEFSAPLITARGNILFGGRWEGKKPGAALFLWTLRGLQALDLPQGVTLSPKSLLEPMFFGHDEAVFIVRGTSSKDASDQFFRALATRTFQLLKPPPDPSDTAQVLTPQPGEKPVQMLMLLIEGDNVQTALIPGDASQPVVAKRPPDGSAPAALGRIEGQTATARGDIVFAAPAAASPNDLGLYCYCEGQVLRLTTPEDFSAITQAAPGKPLLSLVGDAQQTVAFIAPGAQGESSAIYVSSLP